MGIGNFRGDSEFFASENLNHRIRREGAIEEAEGFCERWINNGEMA